VSKAPPKNYEALLDTKWGCGYIRVKAGRIVKTAPIFRRLIGQTVPRCYKVLLLEEEEEEDEQHMETCRGERKELSFD